MGYCQWFSMGYFYSKLLWIHARPSGRVIVSLSWNLCVQRKNKGSMMRRRARMPTLYGTVSNKHPGALHFSKMAEVFPEADFHHKSCTKLIGKLENFGKVTKYNHLTWKSYGICNSSRIETSFIIIIIIIIISAFV